MQASLIDRLINKNFWAVSCHHCNYGFIWVMMGPNASQLERVRDLSEGADLEWSGLSEYLAGQGAWLPVAIHEESMMVALGELNERLSKLPPEHLEPRSRWEVAVFDAYDKLLTVNDGAYGIALAMDKGLLVGPPE